MIDMVAVGEISC